MKKCNLEKKKEEINKVIIKGKQKERKVFIE